MKSSSLLLTISLLLLFVSCKSEVDQKTAAEVSETTSTTVTPASEPGIKASVIKDKSKIEFVGAKITRDHHGEFKNFDGSIEYVSNKPARISFDIDLNSVETDTPKLTGHLKTPDFFDVAKYPKATFTASSITELPVGSPNGQTHTVTGILDLHGTQKEVTFPVSTQTTAEGVRATSEFTINRHDWGISYRGAADDLIKDNVLIKLDLLFPPPAAAPA